MAEELQCKDGIQLFETLATTPSPRPIFAASVYSFAFGSVYFKTLGIANEVEGTCSLLIVCSNHFLNSCLYSIRIKAQHNITGSSYNTEKQRVMAKEHWLDLLRSKCFIFYFYIKKKTITGQKNKKIMYWHHRITYMYLNAIISTQMLRYSRSNLHMTIRMTEITWFSALCHFSYASSIAN